SPWSASSWVIPGGMLVIPGGMLVIRGGMSVMPGGAPERSISRSAEAASRMPRIQAVCRSLRAAGFAGRPNVAAVAMLKDDDSGGAGGPQLRDPHDCPPASGHTP